MTKTANDLVYEAAGILGIAVAGEALGAVEYDTINSNIDPVLAEVERLVHIGNRDAIPDLFFQTIARLVAVHSAGKLSNSPVSLDQIRLHEDRLQYLAATGRLRRTLRVDAGVLQDGRLLRGRIF
jgi:hypothetical protein